MYIINLDTKVQFLAVVLFQNYSHASKSQPHVLEKNYFLPTFIKGIFFFLRQILWANYMTHLLRPSKLYLKLVLRTVNLSSVELAVLDYM